MKKKTYSAPQTLTVLMDAELMLSISGEKADSSDAMSKSTDVVLDDDSEGFNPWEDE